MTNKRIVFDTNVLISALLLEESTPACAFFTALRHDNVLVSIDTLQEIQTVIRRKKFDKYVTKEERDLFITRLTTSALLIEITETITASQDAKRDSRKDTGRPSELRISVSQWVMAQQALAADCFVHKIVAILAASFVPVLISIYHFGG